MLKRKTKLEISEIAKRDLPLLIRNKEWCTLFATVKDSGIASARKELEKVLDEDQKMNLQFQRLKQEKKKIMEQILKTSDLINNEKKSEHLDFLDECKRNLQKLNEELDDLQYMVETHPKMIREANLKLMEATVNYGYDQLITMEKLVEQLKIEIEEMRLILKEKVSLRIDSEEQIDGLYMFFHNILGGGVVEEIDKERLV